MLYLAVARIEVTILILLLVSGRPSDKPDGPLASFSAAHIYPI